jgi:hypothetical protein
MQAATEAALAMRDELLAEGQCESVSFVEIDCVNAFRVLMARGSSRLRSALVTAALSHAVVLKAA